MSLPTGTDAVAPDVKPAAVVDNVNDHTPEPTTPPVVDQTPEPPRPDTDGLTELRELVTNLATTVTALTDKVTSLVQDEGPRQRPWTHKGGPVR